MPKQAYQFIATRPEDAVSDGCQQPGCGQQGLYRAPLRRDQPGKFLLLCLDHVRAYNAGWDWYKGMSAEEIEAERRRDTTWRRPTWRLGSGPDGCIDREEVVRRARDFGFTSCSSGASGRRPAFRSEEEARAMRRLGFDAPASFAEIKARYKLLAKRLHPDSNGGDKRAEDRLKSVNEAYATLKALHGVRVS